MCCFLTVLLLLGPRVGGAIWWIARPVYWDSAFSSWIWPLAGLIFLPWTTLMYMIVFPGGVTGFEWILVGCTVFADIAQYTGSGYQNRHYIPGFSNPTSTPPL